MTSSRRLSGLSLDDKFVRTKNAPEATQKFGLLPQLSKLGEEQRGERRKEEEKRNSKQKKEHAPKRKKGVMHKGRARKKAACERGSARVIPKKSTKLNKDKWLEIMELAASSKAWLSMESDTDSSESLHLSRDMLVTFPPESVQLSRPFAIEPWNDSEENVGNLLMIWTILITFAEVLVLRPFTLDEFVQAFHDSDSRLLVEIHVALLSCIIKDIEDVANTASMKLGTNRNNSANPACGHPQIVEGADAWEFDIHSWQHHLNTLKWPEVLCQFALSAGFGPQLKKRSIGQLSLRDANEGHTCEHIVSTLRNGATSVSAAAVMQEKGLSRARRSGHRLTPGTLKFAVFSVLSLEGSMGLSTLELVDKIEESGLWDFTQSKTPEISVGTTLSRESRERKLFEKTVPSTYCLRAEFRNDPNDADAILSAAREEIRYKSVACLKTRKRKKVCNEVGEILQSGHGSAPGTSLSLFPSEGSQEINNSGALIGHSADLARNSNVTSTDDLEDAEIDESNTGEPWVRELMKGKYADLPAEKRLNALVALIGVAIEGKSVCVILEEWSEAANALKKRMKEECITKPQSLPFIKSLPLGQDRKRNRYWQFVTSASINDPGTGRIFYESAGGCWRLIDTEEAFDSLLESLDMHVIRESHLHLMLQKVEVSFKDAVTRKNHVDHSEIVSSTAGIGSHGSTR